MAASASTVGRIPQIDVLRGMAALGVFFFHVSGALQFPKKTLPPFELFGETWSTIPSVFSFGATGVSLFFVISGFCLALQPLSRSQDVIDVRRYYRDRVARIYPAYFLAVLFSALVTTLRGIPWTGMELLTFLGFCQGLVQQWVFSFNGALWSMATEIQFYVVFPLLFALLVRAGKHRFLFGSMLVVFSARLLFALSPWAAEVTGGITTSAFLMNNLPGRLLEFAAGMLVAQAFLADRNALGRACAVALIPALAIGGWARAYGPLWLVDPLVGLMYAAVLGCAVSRFHFVRDSSLMARFGRSSYSFFLIHFPVLSLIAERASWLDGMSSYPKFLALSFVSLAATLPLSFLLYRYVELPMWRRFRI